MSDSDLAATPLSLGAPELISTASVSDQIVDELLKALDDGRLVPGMRLNEIEIAKSLSVSRTPVREATQRLRDLGLVETSPQRYVRVSSPSPLETRDALTTWTALYLRLIEELPEKVDQRVIRRMEKDHRAFLAAAKVPNAAEVASANHFFYLALTEVSTNKSLRRALNSVVYVVRLGSLNLPNWIDIAALEAAHTLLLKALKAADRAAAADAIKMVSQQSTFTSDAAEVGWTSRSAPSPTTR